QTLAARLTRVDSACEAPSWKTTSSAPPTGRLLHVVTISPSATVTAMPANTALPLALTASSRPTRGFITAAISRALSFSPLPGAGGGSVIQLYKPTSTTTATTTPPRNIQV